MRTRLLYLWLFPVVVFSSFAGTPRFRSGILLHHSTGACIWGPNGGLTSVPAEVTAYNAARHLSGTDACILTETWWPSTDDNEWSTWHLIFENAIPSNDIRPIVAANPIVMIKSCFPSSNIAGAGSVGDTANPMFKSVSNYKWHWRSIVRVMQSRPQNFFVIWTNAPQVASNTTDAEARLADQFCRWAKDTLAAGKDPVVAPFPPNIYVFDFFHALAGADGRLPLVYASSASDSHPNASATTAVAPQLTREVLNAALAYDSLLSIIPAPPQLLGPSNGIANQKLSVDLHWMRPASAVSFRLQVGRDSLFTAPLILDDSTLVDTSRVVDGLARSTRYFWRVKAASVAGPGPFSGIWSFLTLPGLPFRPALVVPENSATLQGSVVRFAWRRVEPEVTHYWHEMSPDSFFLTPSLDSTLVDTACTRTVPATGTYWWRVRAFNGAGWGPFSEVRTLTAALTGVEPAGDVPTEHGLAQNFPNPFNPSTRIRYSIGSGVWGLGSGGGTNSEFRNQNSEIRISVASWVRLSVCDLLGRDVAVLVNEQKQPGSYEVVFDGSRFTSGMYFCRLAIAAGDPRGTSAVLTRRMILLK